MEDKKKRPFTGLFAEFSSATPEQWRTETEASLKGKPFDKIMFTPTHEGITLKPIYTAHDTHPLGESLPGFAPFVRGFNPAGYRKSGWQVAQRAGGCNAQEINADILDTLNRGQNAVNVKYCLEAHLADIFAGVKLDCIAVTLRARTKALQAWDALKKVARDTGADTTAMFGAIGYDPLSKLAKKGSLCRKLEEIYADMSNLAKEFLPMNGQMKAIDINACLWREAGADCARELGLALAAASEYLQALTESGLTANQAASLVRISFGLGGDFFMEIAKLRAARLVWWNFAQAWGVDDASAAKLSVHARTLKYNKTKYDPHVNMLRTTTETLSAVLGGADSIEVGPYDEVFTTPQEFSRRVARNQQLLLSEECGLANVIDPAGGSWYVENLTWELANKAWEYFRLIEDKGGLAHAIADGFVQQDLAAVHTKKTDALCKRQLKMVGTNMYANVNEPMPPAGKCHACGTKPACSAPAVSATPLTKERLALPFENMRDAMEQFVQKSGRRPAVFAAGFGPAGQYKARADFSRGFFEVAGLAFSEEGSMECPVQAAQKAVDSGAEIVVICSTDATYPDIVPVFAKKYKELAPDKILVLAGYPAELVDSFKTAGVDEFIHIKADAAAMLKKFLGQLGVL